MNKATTKPKRARNGVGSGAWLGVRLSKHTNEMNNLEALVIVRNCAVYSPQLQTRQGKAALAVVDRKIQSLLRKKAWRDGDSATPIHMADANFKYPLPESEVAVWQKRSADLYEIAVTLKRHAVEAQSMYGVHAEELIADADRVLSDVNSNSSPNVRDEPRTTNGQQMTPGSRNTIDDATHDEWVAASQPMNTSTLPYHLSERCFRAYEPHIRKAVAAWPQETQFSAAVMTDEEGKRFSPHTFAARLRDSLVSLKRYGWATDIDLDKLWSITGEYAIAYASDGTVWWKARGKRGRPSDLTPEARARAERLQGLGTVDTVQREWSKVTEEELRALAVLLHGQRLTGTFVLDFPDQPADFMEIESKYNVSIVYDNANKKTVIT